MNKEVKDDLYSRVVCALTHNISVCSECKKCGKNGIEGRMNMIRELSKVLNKDLPWVESNEE